MELYKKHRPATLDALVGNAGAVASVRKMIAAKAVPHSVLFTGPSGCGKTTVARIVARELGVSELDLRELDSAQFRGIDTAREIRQTMTLAPMSGPCRVWVLDEVHKMTADGQNAMLKALEDTPAHVWFLLCTTEPDKLIRAIRTRCTEIRFGALAPHEIGPLLVGVCNEEKVSVGRETLRRIARECNGSARAALVALEKVIGLSDEEASAALDTADADEADAIELCRALLKRASWQVVAGLLKRVEKQDAESVRRKVLGYMRAALLGGNAQAYRIAICFEKNYFDNGATGLALSCFEAVHAKRGDETV
jgi:DNA polymerase-3 subunit gamma/tau